MTTPQHDRADTLTASTSGKQAATTEGAVQGRGLRMPGSPLLRHALLMLAAFVGIVLLLESVSAFTVTQLSVMAFYLPAVAGLTVLTGLNGQISLGHGALMAVGAYTTAVLLERQEGLPFLVVLLAAVALTTVVGTLVGVAAARLHGPYLAGATLALAVGITGIALKFPELLGGEQGLRVSPPDAPEAVQDVAFFITGNELDDRKYLAYLGWVLALLVLLLLSNLIVSRYGRTWRAVRDDEVAAELTGIDLGKARVLAFVVSAACAGVAGAMFAVVSRLAAPTSFTVTLSITLLVAIVIGGLGSLVGALLGSAMVAFFATEVTERALSAGLDQTAAANVAPLLYGIVLILVMLLAPRGVVGSLRFAYLGRKASRQMAAAQHAKG